MSAPTRTVLFHPLPDKIAESPAQAEEATLAKWRAEKTFEAVQRARADAPAFVFWEGPPTANGRPGIHHVTARAIKDIVGRYNTMLGRRVVRKAGWDTHGLPVELEVEKKLGINGKPEIEKYGVAAFNAKCRESVWTYKKEWEELSERIGYWLDYADPYVTYDEHYVESVWYLLQRFYDEGFVYQGKKVLPYCGRCGTGLSSHELGQPGVYRDVMDPSVIVRFRLRESHVDPSLRKDGESESILAWTTTPWTLPSNIALAVHPEQEYECYRIPLAVPKGEDAGSRGFERVWIASQRAEATFAGGAVPKFGSAHVSGVFAESLTRKQGADMVGWAYEPLFETRPPEIDPGAWIPERALGHRVVAANYVSMEDGTGVVHQAPAYGVDDWDTARSNRLSVLQAVGPEGRFVVDMLGRDGKTIVAKGTFFKEADKALTIDLKERGLLFKSDHASHSYPHCWRCDTALYYFATPAWYIRTTAYKDKMVEHNRKIRWIPPEVGEKRFGEWLEGNIDWNISRDRYWGTPLPFWVCESDATHVVAIGSVAQMRERVARSKSATSKALPAGFDNHKPLIDEVVFDCDACAQLSKTSAMRRTKSVLDCWFDSGAMPYAQYGWPHVAGSREKVRDQFPADCIAEGLDQTRGWFYTLHAIGVFMTEIAGRTAPSAALPDGDVAGNGPTYRTCIVNGLVLDKDGVKMSKRLGNVIDPWKAIGEHGADAVRWYMLSSGQPWLPKRFDLNGIVEVRRKFFGTLINSYKFFAEYARLADGFDSRSRAIPKPHDRPAIDRWILSRCNSLVRDVRARMHEYDIAGACRAIEAFVIDDLSNWYIRRNRARIWKGGAGPDKLAAFATLHTALSTTALLAAPMAPFLPEMLWERLQGEGSVHAQLLPVPDLAAIDLDLEESVRIVKELVEMGRALRERANLKLRQPLRAMHVRASHERSLELLRTRFAAEQILGELNIKGFGTLATDDGQLCTLRAKANFKTLGPKLGPRMKAAAQAIEQLPSSDVARLRAGESITISIAGEPFEAGPADVQITVETRADFDVETDGRFVVYFDTELDEELVLEGFAREAINRVNGLRKDHGLAVVDRVRLRMDCGADAALRKSLERFGELVCAETLAAELTFGEQAFERGASETFDLGPGRQLTVHLARVEPESS
ncbi:MAG: isoleucine--tRNA ligase [Planctomycetota bacterium]